MTIFTFGIQPPSDARVAYGCRAIDYGTHVDVPHNRQSFHYETDEELTAFLFAMNQILGQHVANFAQQRMNEMTRNGHETYEPTVIYSDEYLVVMCRRSGGYLHVGAWSNDEEPPKNRRKGTFTPTRKARDYVAELTVKRNKSDAELSAKINEERAEEAEKRRKADARKAKKRPKTVAKPTRKRSETVAKPTRKRPKAVAVPTPEWHEAICDVCGQPSEYCLGCDPLPF